MHECSIYKGLCKSYIRTWIYARFLVFIGIRVQKTQSMTELVQSRANTRASVSSVHAGLWLTRATRANI